MKFKKIFNTRVLLIAIIILASILRIWQLGNVPPSPDWDEVALGYDAYSFIHTGKDEFGKTLPVVLRSYDDYKPALYVYLTVPSVLLFGLNTFAVRLPSALFGILTVFLVYHLVKELFKEYKHKVALALTASFFLAISPWSLQFSRVGFEANVGVAFNVLCVLFFLKSFKKPWMLIFAAIFAALGPYVYQSEKVFSPLLVLILGVVYFKDLLKLPRKFLIWSIIIGFIVILPMVLNIAFDKNSLQRAKGTSIFSAQTQLLSTSVQKFERDKTNNDLIGVVLDNRRVEYLKNVVSGYLSHFDLNWLFIHGDIQRHHAPGMGLLYLFELPFILIGIYKLLFGEFNRKSKLLIFLWFLAAAIPASITTGVPHAVRTLNYLPLYQIFTALGVIVAYQFISEIKMHLFGLRVKTLIFIFAILIFIGNFAYYLNQYFVQQNYFHSREWQYGYEDAVKTVEKLSDNYDKIVISDTSPMDKSYMFFLFYTKYPPQQFQNETAANNSSKKLNFNFGKFEFRPVNWEEDVNSKNTLFVAPPQELPEGAGLIKSIKYLNGEEAIKIVGT